MDSKELRAGDTVLIEATVRRIVEADAPTDPAIILVAIDQNQLGTVGPAMAALHPDTVHAKLGEQAAPATPAWPLGTLAKTQEDLRNGT